VLHRHGWPATLWRLVDFAEWPLFGGSTNQFPDRLASMGRIDVGAAFATDSAFIA
jgi:hypothetical protein